MNKKRLSNIFLLLFITAQIQANVIYNETDTSRTEVNQSSMASEITDAKTNNDQSYITNDELAIQLLIAACLFMAGLIYAKYNPIDYLARFPEATEEEFLEQEIINARFHRTHLN